MFNMYDSNQDGYLNMQEFANIVHDLKGAGGRLKRLAKPSLASDSCCHVFVSWMMGAMFGYFGPLPKPALTLFGYIEHR